METVSLKFTARVEQCQVRIFGSAEDGTRSTKINLNISGHAPGAVLPRLLGAAPDVGADFWCMVDGGYVPAYRHLGNTRSKVFFDNCLVELGNRKFQNVTARNFGYTVVDNRELDLDCILSFTGLSDAAIGHMCALLKTEIGVIIESAQIDAFETGTTEADGNG